MNDSRGGVAFPTQLLSVKLEFGVTTNCSPVLNCLSWINDGSQTAKQVGYPNQVPAGLVGSPTGNPLASIVLGRWFATRLSTKQDESLTIIELFCGIISVNIRCYAVDGPSEVLLFVSFVVSKLGGRE